MRVEEEGGGGMSGREGGGVDGCVEHGGDIQRQTPFLVCRGSISFERYLFQWDSGGAVSAVTVPPEAVPVHCRQDLETPCRFLNE